MLKTVRHIAEIMEFWAPPATQLEYDNVGILVGDATQQVSKVLVCLDVTQAVVEEAVAHKVDLIVAHHPLIFKKMNTVTKQNPVGSLVHQLIQSKISLFVSHTNLDAAKGGVSFVLAETLGLKNIALLNEGHHSLARLELYGVSGFQENMLSSEIVGFDIDVLNYSDGVLTVQLDAHRKKTLLNHLKNQGVEWTSSSNLNESGKSPFFGLGAIGSFDTPMHKDTFLSLISEQLGAKAIRYSGESDQIKNVAVCGGAGVGLLQQALRTGADAFVTADIKYHEFFLDKSPFLLVDAGHYETEAVILNPIATYLRAQLKDTVEVLVTRTNTNPMKPFYNKTKP